MTGINQGLLAIAFAFSVVQLLFLLAGIVVFAFLVAVAEAIWKSRHKIGYKKIKHRRKNVF